MIVRRAVMEDVDSIVEMSRAFYATTSYAGFTPMSDESAGLLAEMLIETGVMLVAEKDGAVVGMVGLIVAPFMFNAAVLTAHEIVWYVRPEEVGKGAGAALLAAIEPACRERGVVAIQMVHLSTSPPQAAALYERMGYRYTESSYTKEL